MKRKRSKRKNTKPKKGLLIQFAVFHIPVEETLSIIKQAEKSAQIHQKRVRIITFVQQNYTLLLFRTKYPFPRNEPGISFVDASARDTTKHYHTNEIMAALDSVNYLEHHYRQLENGVPNEMNDIQREVWMASKNLEPIKDSQLYCLIQNMFCLIAQKTGRPMYFGKHSPNNEYLGKLISTCETTIKERFQN